MTRRWEEDEQQRRGKRPDKLDTIDIREKRSGRGRPAPSRGIESIVDPAVERIPSLVVGALPAHVEVLMRPDGGGVPSREDVKVVRVHPALVAALQSSLVVGDRIEVATLDNGQSWAVSCTQRTTVLARPAVEREKLQQPIVANADALWVVVAVENPALNAGLVDRFFVAAAAGGLDFRLLATKADLPGDAESLRWLDFYEGELGLTVARTSAVTGQGVDDVRRLLAGHFSALVGQSGVGKSSVVRAMLPSQPIAVGEVSAATGKGRHTTTVTRWYGLPEGGAVVDTPGLRELGLWGVDRRHLDVAFADVARVAAGCRFDDCRHRSEPGCEVRGHPSIRVERLTSWQKLSDEVDDRLKPGFGKPGGPVSRG